MLNFTDKNMSAKEMALHYANKLKHNLAIETIHGNKDITTKEEAIELTDFFWSMTDEAVKDEQNNIEVVGVNNLQFWMEKLMNIFIGYLSRCGFKDEWVRESNRINGHS